MRLQIIYIMDNDDLALNDPEGLKPNQIKPKTLFLILLFLSIYRWHSRKFPTCANMKNTWNSMNYYETKFFRVNIISVLYAFANFDVFWSSTQKPFCVSFYRSVLLSIWPIAYS